MKSERPALLTAFCILGLAACSIGIILVYNVALTVGKLYALYRSLGLTFLVFCFGGLFLMRRWTVWGLGGYFLVNQAVCWAFGTWDKSTLASLVPLAVAAAYYRRMK